MNRRQAILKFCQFVAASPLLRADRKYSELGDQLLKQANVFDFARLAKTKLDPLAWDYLDEGSDDEVSLHANRTRFDDIIIRPHFLINDVSSIDTSITLFGKQLTQPIYLSVTGGKNCFIPNGEQEAALAAGTSNSMMITGGGINNNILSAGKGPKVWWHFTTAAEFRTKNQMVDYAEKLEDRAARAYRSQSISTMSLIASAAFITGWCATGASRPKEFPETKRATLFTSRTIFSGRPAMYQSRGHFQPQNGRRYNG